MLKNYIKIAWRNLWKHKLFSFINIMGLGLAFPFALLSLMQVQSAFESDNFHPHPERTYRIVSDVTSHEGGKAKYAPSPQVTAQLLQQNYPSIEKATFVVRDFGWELNNRIKVLKVNMVYVEPQFFDLFGFYFSAGVKPIEPNSLAITEEKALAFFGHTDVVGKTLIHPDFGSFSISGVIKPYKRNTHFRSDVMVSMATHARFSTPDKPTALSGFTYVLLRQEADVKSLDAALSSVAKQINKLPDALAAREQFSFRKQLVTAIAPDTEDLRGNAYVDNTLDLSVNFAFAMALLLLAGFNYVNLTLARSLSRAKEVGVRKVSGASRYQLVGQFICEAILVALLALIVGYVVLKLLEQFSYVNWFAWQVDNQFYIWVAFVLFAICIGALAGWVPAKVLSRFQPAKVLKGAIAPSSFGRMGLRNSLVVIQFVASCCFIFVIATLYSQFVYMATDNENFNRAHIYNLSVGGNHRVLKQELAAHKNVERIGLVSSPFGGTTAQVGIRKNNREQNTAASYYAADADFVNNMQLKLVAGSNMPVLSGDSAANAVVVNEQLVMALGLGDAKQAIGKSFVLNDAREVHIQGVVQNFCYYHYQFTTMPLVLHYNPAKFQVLSIKTNGTIDEAAFKLDIATLWKKYFPGEQASISNYEKDLYDRYFPGRDMKFMGVFCVVVFVIAIMGLLGIVTYHTEKRVKEIGIRKVMGASVPAIVKVLSTSFIKLIFISAAIALPVGYMLCYVFLSVFTFNNGINFLLLTVLFCVLFAIALVTIGYKAIYAANANPVKSLRTE